MKSSQTLAQLALTGIAIGIFSHSAMAEDTSKSKKDTSMTMSSAKDTTAAGMGMDMAKAHECKGHNDCKGMGGCKMSEKDLKKAAKKMGMGMDKAGKAHSCKGMNECKGLGGCKSK